MHSDDEKSRFLRFAGLFELSKMPCSNVLAWFYLSKQISASVQDDVMIQPVLFDIAPFQETRFSVYLKSTVNFSPNISTLFLVMKPWCSYFQTFFKGHSLKLPNDKTTCKTPSNSSGLNGRTRPFKVIVWLGTRTHDLVTRRLMVCRTTPTKIRSFIERKYWHTIIAELFIKVLKFAIEIKFAEVVSPDADTNQNYDHIMQHGCHSELC